MGRFLLNLPCIKTGIAFKIFKRALRIMLLKNILFARNK
jgi:hypothetical protein